MDRQTLKKTMLRYGGERQVFWYFPGRFAFALLAQAAGDGVALRELKRRPEGRLLDRNDVKPLLASLGGGVVRAETFEDYWPHNAQPLVLTLDCWGSSRGYAWAQTSRRGYNLVLRLDLPRGHVQDLKRRVGNYEWLFNCEAHPVAREARRLRETLAWARVDFELEGDVALVEEVQSDWIRDALWAAKHGWFADDREIQASVISRYVVEALGFLAKEWAEAMLCATFWFLRHRLGMRRVYLHEFETGCALKRLRHDKPPRSLYSQLPRRLCMSLSEQAPEFLYTDPRAKRVLKKLRSHRFFTRQLEGGA